MEGRENKKDLALAVQVQLNLRSSYLLEVNVLNQIEQRD
jgi:hypothetical protein